MRLIERLEQHLFAFFEEQARRGYPDRTFELRAWLAEQGRMSTVSVERRFLKTLHQLSASTAPSTSEILAADEKRGGRSRKRSYDCVVAPFDPSRVAEYSQEELKAYCVQFNLVIYGTKELLRQRLLVHYTEQCLNLNCE